jgi:hypothetical protein
MVFRDVIRVVKIDEMVGRRRQINQQRGEREQQSDGTRAKHPWLINGFPVEIKPGSPEFSFRALVFSRY